MVTKVPYLVWRGRVERGKMGDEKVKAKWGTGEDVEARRNRGGWFESEKGGNVALEAAGSAPGLVPDGAADGAHRPFLGPAFVPTLQIFHK
jgi:hypothetical protein